MIDNIPSCSLYPSGTDLDGPIFFTNTNGRELWLQVKNNGTWLFNGYIQPGGTSDTFQLDSNTEIDWAGHKYLAINYDLTTNPGPWCRATPVADPPAIPPVTVPVPTTVPVTTTVVTVSAPEPPTSTPTALVPVPGTSVAQPPAIGLQSAVAAPAPTPMLADTGADPFGALLLGTALVTAGTLAWLKGKVIANGVK